LLHERLALLVAAAQPHKSVHPCIASKGRKTKQCSAGKQNNVVDNKSKTELSRCEVQKKKQHLRKEGG
jgi:hypothetical protein